MESERLQLSLFSLLRVEACGCVGTDFSLGIGPPKLNITRPEMQKKSQRLILTPPSVPHEAQKTSSSNQRDVLQRFSVWIFERKQINDKTGL